MLERRDTSKGLVWGFPPERIDFVEVRDDDPPTEVRCDLCATRHHAPPGDAARWIGRPCLRLRCTGHYVPSPALATNYYRALYRQGQIRRVVAAEHTGSADSRAAGVGRDWFQERRQPRRTERARRHTDARDGHRHRGPLGGDADGCPADPVQLHPARRPRRATDGQRVHHDVRRGRSSQPLFPPGPRADDRRGHLSAQLLPGRDRDPAAPVPRIPHRPRRRRARRISPGGRRDAANDRRAGCQGAPAGRLATCDSRRRRRARAGGCVRSPLWDEPRHDGGSATRPVGGRGHGRARRAGDRPLA